MGGHEAMLVQDGWSGKQAAMLVQDGWSGSHVDARWVVPDGRTDGRGRRGRRGRTRTDADGRGRTDGRTDGWTGQTGPIGIWAKIKTGGVTLILHQTTASASGFLRTRYGGTTQWGGRPQPHRCTCRQHADSADSADNTCRQRANNVHTA